MQLEDIKNITVIGAGTMGHGIGLTYALGGYKVTLQDINTDILSSAMTKVKADLDTMVAYNFILQSLADSAIKNIKTEADLKAAVEDADLVTEAATEKVEVKKAIFSGLDTFCPERTILASNTSSLPTSAFTSQCKRRDRILITHWVNPPNIMPIVEVVICEKTSQETMDVVCALIKKVGKDPVRIMKEIPGLVHNRIQMGMIREVWSLWEQGIASREDIDTVVKGGFGLRLASNGPLETCDLGGLDTWYASAQSLYGEISDAHTPPERVKQLVEAGDLGIKTGKGIFDYQDSPDAKDPSSNIRERDRILIGVLKLRAASSSK